MIINNGTWTIYIHINKINGKLYVGITSRQPQKRWKNGLGYKDNFYFWSAIQKYGWNNFDHELFASNLTQEQAKNMQKILIDKLNATNPQIGYNLCPGGGMPPALKGQNHPFYGIRTQAAIQASVAARIGVPLKEQHANKISNALKQYIKTEQHIRRMSESQKGLKHHRNTKVKCVQLNIVFNSRKQAAQYFGFSNYSGICCAALHGNTYKNYHWVNVQ